MLHHHAIRAERGPFKNLTPGGRHIHHMTFGITGLLTVGYLWMLEIGIAEDSAPPVSRQPHTAAARRSRSTSSPCGSTSKTSIGQSRAARASIAVALFGSLLILSVLSKGFVKELPQALPTPGHELRNSPHVPTSPRRPT